jgi:hypothetical protein
LLSSRNGTGHWTTQVRKNILYNKNLLNN